MSDTDDSQPALVSTDWCYHADSVADSSAREMGRGRGRSRSPYVVSQGADEGPLRPSIGPNDSVRTEGPPVISYQGLGARPKDRNTVVYDPLTSGLGQVGRKGGARQL